MPPAPPPSASPKRKRGPLAAGVLAIVVIVALLAGLIVAVRDDKNNGSVQQAIDRNGTPTVTTAPAAQSSAPPVAGNGDEPIADVARAVGPAVVLIATEEGEGSGIIYDKSGLIITNAHVVGTATTVQVQLADGTVFDDAQVVGADTVRDVAVVKVSSSKDLPVASFGKTDDVRVGQVAVAIGSPFGLEQTVTAGIVSAVGRVISNQNPVEMIQTDAPINPGNSGGALADKQGRVIGMNTSIRTTGSDGGSVGVGFAVPADTFLAIAGRIVSGQSLAVAYLGIRGSSPTGGGNTGVVISTVSANSPASAAGLKVGDLITALNGTKVTSMLGMSARVQLQKPGDTIELTVERDGSTLKVKVTLGSLPR
jgi:putative serine protease PepD